MEDFLLISKYAIMVIAGLFALGGAMVFLSLWIDNNTQDIDAESHSH